MVVIFRKKLTTIDKTKEYVVQSQNDLRIVLRDIELISCILCPESLSYTVDIIFLTVLHVVDSYVVPAKKQTDKLAIIRIANEYDRKNI